MREPWGYGTADPHAPPAGQRVCHDPAAGAGGGDPDEDRQSHLPGHRHHHLPEEKNGGTLEKAALIANHASTRTTQLYDRRNDEVSLDEVERI
jgi:hypothetical protein